MIQDFESSGLIDLAAKTYRVIVVVLPFTNLSNDPNQDYFADGITENLTTDLSRIRNSFVIARNTAFTYKGKNLDAKEIGKELGVRYDHREARRGGFFRRWGGRGFHRRYFADFNQIHPDRLGDVLELLQAEIVDRKVEPSLDLPAVSRPHVTSDR
jgi:hypothetical protein